MQYMVVVKLFFDRRHALDLCAPLRVAVEKMARRIQAIKLLIKP